MFKVPNPRNFMPFHLSWQFYMPDEITLSQAFLYFAMLNRSNASVRAGDGADIRVGKGWLMQQMRYSERSVETCLTVLLDAGYLRKVEDGHGILPPKYWIKPWSEIVEDWRQSTLPKTTVRSDD